LHSHIRSRGGVTAGSHPLHEGFRIRAGAVDGTYIVGLPSVIKAASQSRHAVGGSRAPRSGRVVARRHGVVFPAALLARRTARVRGHDVPRRGSNRDRSPVLARKRTASMPRVAAGGAISTMMLGDGRAAEEDASERVPPALEASELGRPTGVQRHARARPGKPDGEALRIRSTQVAPDERVVRIAAVAAAVVTRGSGEIRGPAGPTASRGPIAPVGRNAAPLHGLHATHGALPSPIGLDEDMSPEGRGAKRNRA
jgi:hypothetical protein